METNCKKSSRIYVEDRKEGGDFHVINFKVMFSQIQALAIVIKYKIKGSLSFH